MSNDTLMKRVYEVEERIRKIGRNHPEYSSLMSELSDIQYQIEKYEKLLNK